MIDKEPSVKEMAALWKLCADFIEENDITCSETIYQTDWVYHNSYVLIEKICDEVGYCGDEE